MSAPRGLPRAPEGARPGDLVSARAWKYDDGPHWVVPGLYLGSDAHGHWVFQPRGSFVARPGAAFFARSDAVCLFPHEGEWVATFYDQRHPGDIGVYVDISTEVGWAPLREGWEANSIDMDLDVVRSASRGVYIDDEDEFAEHAVSMAYPPQLVEAMRRACAEVHGAVLSRTAPFDGTSERWRLTGRTLLSARDLAVDPLPPHVAAARSVPRTPEPKETP